MNNNARMSRKMRILTITICLTVWSMTAFIMFGEDAGPRVMPGKLTHHHAAFVSDCGHCHDDDMSAFKGLSSGLVHSEMAIREGRRCLECHDFGATAFSPHSVPPATLAQFIKPNKDPGSTGDFKNMLLSVGLPISEKGEIACAVCHREHGGRNHDLKDVADLACQSCHQDHADEFPRHHTEFAGFPYDKPKTIKFNHGAHFGKNFPEKGAEFDCALCHSGGAGGNMTTRPFQESCTSCHHHEEQILGQGKMQAGVAIITAFGLDLESLEEYELEVSDWPADGADYDEPPTALTWLLLAGDDSYPERINDRDILSQVDLSDLSEANPSQLMAARRLARSFKKMVRSLAQDPSLFLSILNGVAVDTRQALLLSRFVAGGAFNTFGSKWFGVCSSTSKESTPQEWGGGGRWYLDSEKLALCYVPLGHGDELVAFLHERALASDASSLRQELGSDERCFKCHSADQGDAEFQWGKPKEVAKAQVIHFDHGPHLLAVKSGDCSVCHVVDLTSKAPEKQSSSSHLGSGFLSMSKQDCSQCHAPEQETNRCVDCHNYHLETEVSTFRHR